MFVIDYMAMLEFLKSSLGIYYVEGFIILILLAWITIARIGLKRAKAVKKEGCKRGKIKCISINKEKFEYENEDGLKGTLLMDEKLYKKFQNIEEGSTFDFSYMLLPGKKNISIVFNDDEDLDLDFEFLSTKLIRACKHSVENSMFISFIIVILMIVINYFLGIIPIEIIDFIKNLIKK